MTKDPPREPANRPGDLPSLATRLRSVAASLAVVTLLAIVVDGMLRGLDFARMALWLTVFAVCLLIGAAITAAVYARRRDSG